MTKPVTQTKEQIAEELAIVTNAEADQLVMELIVPLMEGASTETVAYMAATKLLGAVIGNVCQLDPDKLKQLLTSTWPEVEKNARATMTMRANLRAASK